MSRARTPFLAIGHTARDEFPDGRWRLGGSALYGAGTAAKLGARVTLVTRAGPAERDALETLCQELGIALRALPSDVTTTFGFTYDDAGRRTLRLLAKAAPLLHLALRHVGHPATRSRGTIGGSVAHADPAAELPAALLALDAEVIAVGPRGERTIPAGELFLGPFTTSLAPDELLKAIRVPLQGPRRFGFAELARRHGDFALAGVAVLLDPARVVLFGVGGVPVRALEAEQALDERADGPEAAELATRGLKPVSDIHADGDYRRRAAAVLVRRALEQTEAPGA